MRVSIWVTEGLVLKGEVYKVVDREARAPASSRARRRGPKSKWWISRESVSVRLTRGAKGPLDGIRRRGVAGGLLVGAGLGKEDGRVEVSGSNHVV